MSLITSKISSEHAKELLLSFAADSELIIRAGLLDKIGYLSAVNEELARRVCDLLLARKIEDNEDEFEDELRTRVTKILQQLESAH